MRKYRFPMQYELLGEYSCFLDCVDGHIILKSILPSSNEAKQQLLSSNVYVWIRVLL